MNLILKQFLIIGLVFLIILWFQQQDDKKYKRERITLYDQYKFPLLVSSFIGLILNLPTLFDMDKKMVGSLTEIAIITPVEKCNMAKTFVHNNNFGSHSKEQMSWFGTGKQASDQQIFTDLPDF
jgi:hypothetical protein